MRIDARTSAAITLDTGLSAPAIKNCLSGRTARDSTRLAILGAARRLGFAAVEAKVNELLRGASTQTEVERAA